MGQVEQKAIEPKRCESVYTVPDVDDTPEHDNEHADETHQCDKVAGHSGGHESVLKPSKKDGKPHAEAIYW